MIGRGRTRRGVGRVLRPAGALTGVLVCVLAGLGVGTAQAQSPAYRYWAFWDGTSGAAGGAGAGWAYATEGPGTARLRDGAVAGFRFSVSADSGKAAQPRTAPDFDALCGGTPARSGTKRIGVVIDFGTAADAPSGERPPAARTGCAQVPGEASAGEALAAVAKPLRYDASALLCGIAGYPRSGCAEQVAGGDPASRPGGGATSAPGEPGAGAGGKDGGAEGDGGGPSAGLVGGIGAVVVLGAAGVWQARRRRG